MKLFIAENESSSKTAVSLDTTGFGHCNLENFIQDVDRDVFVQVSAHPSKI